MMKKLVALLSVLAIGGGLSAAVAQQAPMENKGMKAEALSGFALGKQGWTILHSAICASGRSLLNQAE
jgi:hypothetical protein